MTYVLDDEYKFNQICHFCGTKLPSPMFGLQEEESRTSYPMSTATNSLSYVMDSHSRYCADRRINPTQTNHHLCLASGGATNSLSHVHVADIMLKRWRCPLRQSINHLLCWASGGEGPVKTYPMSISRASHIVDATLIRDKKLRSQYYGIWPVQHPYYRHVFLLHWRFVLDMGNTKVKHHSCPWLSNN